MGEMAKPVPAKQAPPVLEALDLDYTEGGSSPWFIGKGHALVSTVSGPPESADVFTALAREGSMSTLIDFMDTAQPTVSQVALFCYIILGVVLLTLFVLLPMAVLGLRRRMHGVGSKTWIAITVIFLICAGVQVVCLLTMVSTRSAMQDTLSEKAPHAYEWTFELLENYTKLTLLQLKKGMPDKATALDKVDNSTRAGIKWLRDNVTQWEDEFTAYEALQQMTVGLLSLFQIGLLGLALIVSVAAALYACSAWKKRQKALKKGRRSPVFVGIVLIVGAVLLFAHLAVVLPMIARWLPVCVLFDTYLCAPYSSGDFGILDDGVEEVWPPDNRPDPFCRLVPSRLSTQCTTEGTTGIGELPACPGHKQPHMRSIVRYPKKYNVLLQRYPPQLQAIQMQRAGGTNVIGDCFFPFRVVDTDMTLACPLFTDELVGHYMALVISAIFGLLSAVAAAAIATIFLAIGKKKKKAKKKRKRVRRKKKKRRRKKKKKKPQKTPPPSPPPPPPPPLPPPPMIVEQPRPVQIEVPVPVPVPVPVRRRSRRYLPPTPAPPIFIMTPPAPPPPPPPPPPLLIATPPPPPPPQMLMAAPQMAVAPQPQLLMSHPQMAVTPQSMLLNEPQLPLTPQPAVLNAPRTAQVITPPSGARRTRTVTTAV